MPSRTKCSGTKGHSLFRPASIGSNSSFRIDRKRGGWGKRVDFGGRRFIKKKNRTTLMRRLRPWRWEKLKIVDNPSRHKERLIVSRHSVHDTEYTRACRRPRSAATPQKPHTA